MLLDINVFNKMISDCAVKVVLTMKHTLEYSNDGSSSDGVGTTSSKKAKKFSYDIYKNLKRGETFSNVDPEKFYNEVGIDIDTLLSRKKDLEIRSTHVDDKMLDKLTQNLSDTFHCTGVPSNGNEAKRSDFILQFLLSIVSSYRKDIKIHLLREHSVKSEVSHGVVEFIVMGGNKRILIVIEAKKDDWTLGVIKEFL
ncbi:hypothetical protein K439DRAFT_58734 [Ramaria rubella]|nr:hypothetical protein K439DRAFT_58734 [Ramaria rubella]